MRPLIIIIHNNCYGEMHQILGLNDFGTGGEKNCIGINRTEKGKFRDQISKPDIIIINDAPIDNDTTEYLKTCINDNEVGKIYVAFHNDSIPQDRISQEGTIRNIVGNKSLITTTFSHVGSDQFYRSVIEFEQALMGKATLDLETYEDKIKTIIKQIGFNPLLEAKLELLHMCLTPEGAKKVLDGEFPKELESEKQKFWEKTLLELNPNIEFIEGKRYEKLKDTKVSQLAEKFAGGANEQNEYSDCFSEPYLTTLSALRDALLTEN